MLPQTTRCPHCGCLAHAIANVIPPASVDSCHQSPYAVFTTHLCAASRIRGVADFAGMNFRAAPTTMMQVWWRGLVLLMSGSVRPPCVPVRVDFYDWSDHVLLYRLSFCISHRDQHYSADPCSRGTTDQATTWECDAAVDGWNYGR